MDQACPLWRAARLPTFARLLSPCSGAAQARRREYTARFSCRNPRMHWLFLLLAFARWLGEDHLQHP